MDVAPRSFLALAVTAISTACGATGAGTAHDPFIGDWKLDTSKSQYTDVMKVHRDDDRTYTFDFGGSGETVPVDGTDEPRVFGTTLAVTLVGADSVRVVRKKDGIVRIDASWKLSADANTIADDYTEYAPTGEVAVHERYTYQRTADGSGFAGTWEGLNPIPQAFVLQIRPYEDDGLSFIRPAQQVTGSFKLDGKDYPLAGSGAAEGSTTSARRVDEHTLDVTDKTKGAIKRTQRIELSPDQKTLTQTAHPVGQRGANVFVYERQ
jgi:hypothetical protein